MPAVQDGDTFFTGQLNASTPRHLVGQGEITRLINGRFIEGAISNAVGFEEVPIEYSEGIGARLFASPLTYQKLLEFGDVQLVAPLKVPVGEFLILVVSGRLLKVNLRTQQFSDITPPNAYLPPHSTYNNQLSYIDNDGGIYGVGGYLVIFNPYQRPIFVSQDEVRLSSSSLYEMPAARLGATAGKRAFVIVGDNLLYASDPLGGANPLAPLTFEETLNPSGTYFDQVFTVGFALQSEPVTAVCRLPTYLASTQEFLARNLLVSTAKHKFVVAAGAPRNSWESSEFISYAGSVDGIAGPLACTNIGDVVVYISSTGRIKTLSQDQQRETGLSETFIDEPLGQYLSLSESHFYHRDWYRTLDHSRGIIKFNRDRLYASVYPESYPAVDAQDAPLLAPSHRAVAVGSLDPLTRLGPTAAISWEGFYSFLHPVGMVTMGETLYVVSKDEYGRNRIYREEFGSLDTHTTSVYTRGYFTAPDAEGRSALKGQLYFRRLFGPIQVKISYLINGKWKCGTEVTVYSQLHRFSFHTHKDISFDASIPLRIDIDHGGTRFELASIYLEGEVHREVRI